MRARRGEGGWRSRRDVGDEAGAVLDRLDPAQDQLGEGLADADGSHVIHRFARSAELSGRYNETPSIPVFRPDGSTRSSSMNKFPERIWCLYDNLAGKIILKHPYRPGMTVPCPHCGKALAIEKYRATCCGQEFKTSFGEIAQRQPVGEHNRTAGRGWNSLRPYKQDQLGP
jgi:hypothetical protein